MVLRILHSISTFLRGTVRQTQQILEIFPSIWSIRVIFASFLTKICEKIAKNGFGYGSEKFTFLIHFSEKTSLRSAQ